MSQEALYPPRATACVTHHLPAARSRAINEELRLCGVGRDNHDALVALLGCFNRAMDRDALETAEEFQYAIDCILGTISPDAFDGGAVALCSPSAA